LSRKRLEKAERQRVSSELFSLIHGKLHQLAVKHDAARVVQCGLKFGTEEQREAYIEELMPHLVEFSKVQYAHFIVLRLLKVTAKGCHGPAHRARVLRALSGKGAVASGAPQGAPR
jgi:pumilio family protein 6